MAKQRKKRKGPFTDFLKSGRGKGKSEAQDRGKTRSKKNLHSLLAYWFQPKPEDYKASLNLENASIAFPSLVTSRDSKVFRLTAVLTDKIKPDLLQQALDQTYRHFPLYQTVIRRGFFWYFFEESKLQPRVQKEQESPCLPIYHYDHKHLLFKVLYYEKNIHLEVFHALSDGTGAFWFFQLLVSNYVFLAYPEAAKHISLKDADRLPQHDPKEQLADSFADYFKKKRDKQKSPGRLTNASADFKRVLKIKGQRAEDLRMQIIQAEMPVRPLLDWAKSLGVTLSVLLTSLWIEAISKSSQKSDFAVVISVPMNLRQHYPSSTARNFFATSHIGHQFGQGRDSFDEICQDVARQYKEAINKDSIEIKLRTLVKIEQNVAIRPIPRPLKDLILKFFNYRLSRKISSAISNMGVVHFPAPVSERIDHLYIYPAAARPQFTCITHKGELTITFSSPFMGKAIQRNFLRRITDRQIPVTIGLNEVNPDQEED